MAQVAQGQLTATINGKELLGYTKVLDRRQVDRLHVMEGRNFLFNAQGPYSGFGRRVASLSKLQEPLAVRSFVASDGEGFIFTNSQVLYFDFDSQTFIEVYAFTPVDNDWVWQYAYMGGRDYFCKRGVGILEYNPLTSAWKLLDSIYLPLNPCGIAECRGRLIVLGDAFYAWSTVDDADDFEPSLTTGAGAQSLSIIGGTPFAVKKATDSFLVFTSNGIAIGEFSGGQAIFRHRVLSGLHKALSPRVIDVIDESITIFLDAKGLYTCDGRLPQFYDPAFSEFLAEQVLPPRRGDPESFTLQVVPQKNWILLQVGASGQRDVFDLSYIRYKPIEKWGSFDEYFTAFLPLVANISGESVVRVCVLNAEGEVAYFTDENFVQEFPNPEEGNFWFNPPDAEAVIVRNAGEDDYIRFMTFGEMDSIPAWKYAGQATNVYNNAETNIGAMDPMPEPEDGIAEFVGGVLCFPSSIVMGCGGVINGLQVADADYRGLNAYVSVGLARFNELRHDNELGLVMGVSVWNGAEGTAEQVEDWLTLPNQSEDWMLLEGFEDWGIGITSGDEFDVHLVGTNDGRAAFTEKDLILLDNVGSETTRWAGEATGQWHYLNIGAIDYPKTFHLKSVELTGTSAGRLY